MERAELEYVQANQLFIHYDATAWHIGSIFVTASFAIMAASFAQSMIPKWVLPLGSLFLFSIWVMADRHMVGQKDLLIGRLWKLEEQLGLDIHLASKRHHEAPGPIPKKRFEWSFFLLRRPFVFYFPPRRRTLLYWGVFGLLGVLAIARITNFQ